MASGGSGGTTGGVGGAPSGGAAAGGMSAGSGGMSGAPSGGATAGGMSGGDGGAGMGGGGGSDTGGMSGAAAGGGGSDMMTLTSTVITEGDMFPDDNTCAGANTSPDLTWTAGPAGTMSYAMILLDTSNSLNHWVMWDIPASVTSLPAGLGTEAMPSEPAGAKQKAFQGNGYTGPCPSGSDHLYEFTVYALPVATLSSAMTSQQTSALAMEVMDADPLGSASLSAHSSASRNQ